MIAGAAVLRIARRFVGWRGDGLRRTASFRLHRRRAVAVPAARRTCHQRLHLPQHAPLPTHTRRRLRRGARFISNGSIIQFSSARRPKYPTSSVALHPSVPSTHHSSVIPPHSFIPRA